VLVGLQVVIILSAGGSANTPAVMIFMKISSLRELLEACILYIRLEVCTVMTVQNTTSWDVTLCSLIDVYQTVTACLLGLVFDPGDGDSVFL
jgi:hypothetical protein